MKPFRFRPQRVLDWRHKELEQARLGLARTLAAWRRAEREAQAASGRWQSWEDEMHQRRLAGQSVREWEHDGWTLDHLRFTAAAARAEATKALDAVALQRLRLEAARSRAKSLELLKERRLVEHKQAEVTWEQQQLDEWVTAHIGGRTAWQAEG